MATIELVPSEKIASRHPGNWMPGSYYVQTWGCQMNEEDSEQIALYLEGIGLRPAASLTEAQVIIMNTCSVRRKPEDKAFSLIGSLAPLKKAHPEMVLGVCGCMAQTRAKDLKQRSDIVDFVVGTAHISQIASLVEETLQNRRFQTRLELPERKGAVVVDIPQRQLDRPGKLKAYVPIQYGCDKFCSFCIVPSTRGRERSRPTEHILEEVARLAELGTKEITLLGQTVNSYGKNLLEGSVPFSELLWKIAEIDGIERIRYTSPYPRDFKSDLIQAITDCPKVMENVHMPLQSGDSDVLKAMKRQYDVEQFLELVTQIRQAVPHISVSTDIIVGFPGETDEQFENTLETCRLAQFDWAYMFIYSTRPGTPAADMPQVPLTVKKERLARLMELQNVQTTAKNVSLVGQVFEVLCEGPSRKNSSKMHGHTREFRMMHFEAPESTIGKLVKVRATGGHLWGLAGEFSAC